MVGPGIRRKVYMICCAVLFIICAIVALPYLGLNILGAALNPFKRRLTIRDDLYLNWFSLKIYLRKFKKFKTIYLKLLN